MGADIETELGVVPTYAAGSGGIFEVRVGGHVVYTNDRQGGVPPSEPVIAAVRGAIVE